MGKSGVRPGSGLGLTLHEAVSPDGVPQQRHRDPAPAAAPLRRGRRARSSCASGARWPGPATPGTAPRPGADGPGAARRWWRRTSPTTIREKYLRRIYELTTRDDVELLGELGLLEERRPRAGRAARRATCPPAPRARSPSGSSCCGAGPSGRSTSPTHPGPVTTTRRPGAAGRTAAAPDGRRATRRLSGGGAVAAAGSASRDRTGWLRWAARRSRRTSPSIVATRSTATLGDLGVGDRWWCCAAARARPAPGGARRRPRRRTEPTPRCSIAASARRRQSSTWSGSGQNRSPPRGTSRSSARKRADVDALVERVDSKPSRRAVDAAQGLGLGDAHRGVGERTGQVDAVGSRTRRCRRTGATRRPAAPPGRAPGRGSARAAPPATSARARAAGRGCASSRSRSAGVTHAGA